jgi:hypothetical protein
LHYAFDLTIAAANTVNSPAEVAAHLSAGKLRHISIIFPPGCARTCKVSIWDGSNQLFPSNLEACYREDGYAVEVPCNIDLYDYNDTLYLVGWNVGAELTHIIHVLVEVQGPDDLDISESLLKLSEAVADLNLEMRRFF